MIGIPALNDFVSGSRVEHRLAGLIELIKTKTIHKVAKTPDFARGIESLVTIVATSQEPTERLQATAALARAAAVLRAFRGPIGAALRGALGVPLALPEMLRSPEDRYYVAQACRMARAAWCTSYLAQAAVAEESAERARLECLTGVAADVGTLEGVLEQLRAPIAQLAFDTDSPGDSAGRRLRRVLVSLREVISFQPLEVGPSAGRLLADVARAPFKSSGLPQTQEVAAELTEDLLALLHEQVRSRFSLATEVATYEALRVAHELISPRLWPEFARTSPSVRLVERDLLEAITVLVKQGQTDNQLFFLLCSAAGSQDEAQVAMSNLGQSLVGLAPEARAWLLHGSRSSKRSEDGRDGLAAKSQELSENIVIADLLVDCEDLAALGRGVRRDVLPELAILAPALVGQLEGYIGREISMTDVIRSLARNRSLEIRGRVGESLEYSPLEHEMIGGAKLGVRYVRVRKPGVVQVRVGSVPLVVRKALVEPA